MPPIINLKNSDSDCLIRVVSANEQYAVASSVANSSTFVTPKDASLNIATVAVTLRKAIYSTDNFIILTRVVNTTSNVVVARFNQSGVADWDGNVLKQRS